MSSRRKFIKTCVPIIVSPLLLAGKEVEEEAINRYPLPPGAVSLDRFLSKCTACHLCISHCPTKVLKASVSESGLMGFMMPILSYDVHKYCEYECKECIDVCPVDALVEMDLEEKKLTKIASVKLNIKKCVVIANNEDCGACAEHCPTQALTMVPHENGLTKPEIIEPDMCIGCGACESICPELKEAIYIERDDEHSVAKPPSVEVQEQVILDSFGF